jgi:hypothetical protein
MNKEYKISSQKISINLEKQLQNILSNNQNISLEMGLSDRNVRNSLKLHLHTIIYNSIQLNFMLKYFYKDEINNIVEDVIDNLHIMLVINDN